MYLMTPNRGTFDLLQYTGEIASLRQKGKSDKEIEEYMRNKGLPPETTDAILKILRDSR